MRKYIVAATNIIIICIMMVIVIGYSEYSSREKRENRIREFENLTVGMVQTTANYLYGAQQVANSWGNYINSGSFTIDEAVSFMRKSQGEDSRINGQILFIDQEENAGLSTDPDIEDPDKYDVRYIQDTLFNGSDIEKMKDQNGKIHMTRMFTNQINGKQSVAFYHPVRLKDQEDGSTRQAIVLYVIPVSDFDYNLKISNSHFETVSSVIITRNGDYISKNSSFKNSNFFEFLNSYNEYDKMQMETIRKEVTEGHGVLEVLNYQKQPAHVAYASEGKEDGFIVISMLNDSDLVGEKTDLRLSVTIGVGLLILFCFNIIVVMMTNNRLNHAVQEAEKASLAKTEFLSTMSHDIRTPLNAILGFTTLALQQKDRKEVVEENLTKISMAGNHLLMLINDILDISQIENHGIQLEIGTVSVAEIITTLQSIAEPIAEEKQIALELRSQNITYPYILVDQLRLNQIYVNLMGNALKYTNKGGSVKVILEEQASEDPKTVFLQATISDTGIGMSEEFLPKMFDSFAREEDGRTSKISGTGLGLAITRHLVDLMEGTIDCKSEVGRGTTFTVRIAVPIAETPDVGEENVTIAKVEGMHILVAEDNKLNWEIVSSMLELSGLTAERAVNGQEAVAMVKKDPQKYDVVLMDLRMPVMDGIEATRRIRAEADETLQKIPIVALTADAFTENIKQCLQAGMDAHISKPIDMDELLKTLAKVRNRV